MQETKSTSILPTKRSHTSFYITLLFACSIIGALIWLSLYNTYLSRTESHLVSQIGQTQKSIEEVSREKSVIIAKIEASNTVRPSIDLKWLVNDFYDAASRANVRLKGFSIANDVISTSLISTQPDGSVHPDSASTIIKMMRTYGNTAQWRFALEPITAISGTPELRTTGIQFRVTSLPTP